MTQRPDVAVGRSFLKLGAGEAAARLIAFAATVYLARLLGPGVYGVIVLALAILLYVSSISDCGVDMLGVHDVAREGERLPQMLAGYLGARLLVALGMLVLLLGLGFTVLPQPEGAILAAYAFLLLPLALGTRWVHVGLEQGGKAAMARVLSEGVAALMIVVLIREPGDVARAPLAQLVGEGVGAFLLLRLLPGGSARVHPVARWEVVGSLFRRSWPVVAHTLLGLLMFNSDFFFLRVYRDSATVGYYAVAYTLVSFLLNLGGTYAMSLLPVLTRLREQPERERGLYQDAMVQLFTGGLPIALGAGLLAGRLMQLVFGAAYLPSASPLQILVWCVPVVLFRHVAQSALLARGLQDQLMRTAIWGAGSNLVLNATLIPVWGMTGAAVATVATEAVRTVLALRYASLAGLALPAWRRFWRPLLAGGVMTVALILGWIGTLWLSIAVGGLAYLLTLSFVGGLRVRWRALPELTV